MKIKKNKEKKKNNTYIEENKITKLLIEKFKKVKIQGINEKDFSFKNWQYALKWENSKKYTQIFFKEILLLWKNITNILWNENLHFQILK